jgi:hypothetical protein
MGVAKVIVLALEQAAGQGVVLARQRAIAHNTMIGTSMFTPIKAIRACGHRQQR